MKKYLCLLLVLSMCIGVFASDTFADLKKYGIMQGDPDGAMRLEDEVTRAEVAKMIVAALGQLGTAELPCDTVFEDVTSAYWASGFIHAAYAQGIIHGKTKTTFAPEDHITNEEVIKMIVCALGYGEMANARGGYPFGYMMLADKLGILKGLDLVGTKEALRGDIATMLTNALDIPLMMQVGFGSVVEWQIMNGENGIPLRTWRTVLTAN